MQLYTQISWIISPKYHLFINSELNNLEIPNNVPNGFDEDTEEQKDKYFETEHYLNKQLFIDKKDTIKTYDVILIDEIQDYRRAWMEIIKECFLSENGEYVLFGDVKQFMYNDKTEGKDVSTSRSAISGEKVDVIDAFLLVA